MARRVTHILLVALLAIASAGTLHAQKYPERRHIRSGNREYQKENYAGSEVEYRRALERSPINYEAAFNLANSLYKQERYAESAQIFQQLAQDTSHVANAAAAYYNAGNALFMERKLKEALEEYKNSLRSDPTDMDAKFNLAYVKKLLDEQDGGGGGNDQNQDQNQDQNKEGDQNQEDDQNKDGRGQDQNKDKGQNGDQDKDKGDQDKDKGDQQKQDGKGEDNKDGDGKNEDKPGGGQPKPQGMQKAEADQMLEAIQAQEDKTQEKVDEKKKAAVVSGSRRNW